MDSKAKVIKIITVSAVILIFLLAISLTMNLVKLANANSAKNKLEQQIAKVDAQIEQNSKDIAELESSEYLDWFAREYLNMKGRDEKAFDVK